MTITIIHKTANYQRRITEVVPQGTETSYVDVPGELTQRDVKGMLEPLLFDGMLDAQSEYGQITWVNVTPTWARGLQSNTEHGGSDQIVVIDVDHASVREALDALTWVQGALV